jgi:hypothetical protein
MKPYVRRQVAGIGMNKNGASFAAPLDHSQLMKGSHRVA